MQVCSTSLLLFWAGVVIRTAALPRWAPRGLVGRVGTWQQRTAKQDASALGSCSTFSFVDSLTTWVGVGPRQRAGQCSWDLGFWGMARYFPTNQILGSNRYRDPGETRHTGLNLEAWIAGLGFPRFWFLFLRPSERARGKDDGFFLAFARKPQHFRR